MSEVDNFGDELLEFLASESKKEKNNKKELFTGLVIYPINGRAAVPDGLMGHWAYSRDDVIYFLFEELFESEPKYKKQKNQIFDLLMKNDRVRVGRIILQIIHMEKSISTDGIEAI